MPATSLVASLLSCDGVFVHVGGSFPVETLSSFAIKPRNAGGRTEKMAGGASLQLLSHLRGAPTEPAAIIDYYHIHAPRIRCSFRHRAVRKATHGPRQMKRGSGSSGSIPFYHKAAPKQRGRGDLVGGLLSSGFRLNDLDRLLRSPPLSPPRPRRRPLVPHP